MHKIFLLVCILLSLKTEAQYFKNECATPSSKEDFISKIDKANLRVLAAGTRIIKMHIIIYTDDDGSNQAMLEEEVKREIKFADSVFNIGNICFSIVGVEIRNSTTFNNPIYGVTDFATEIRGGAFNVFVVNKVFGTSGLESGIFGWVPNVIAPYMITKKLGFGLRRTFIHEIGHALGLEHTFKGTGLDPNDPGIPELVNGSNGFTAGDFVQDTNADPYTKCGTSISGCTFPYTAPSCADANNASYTPIMTNYMSYWANSGCNRTTFTNGQYERMVIAVDFSSVLNVFLAPDYLTFNTGTLSSGWGMYAAKYNISLNNNYTVNGSAKATYSAGYVTLNPGFVAAPSTNGVVRILGSYCQ